MTTSLVILAGWPALVWQSELLVDVFFNGRKGIVMRPSAPTFPLPKAFIEYPSAWKSFWLARLGSAGWNPVLRCYVTRVMEAANVPWRSSPMDMGHVGGFHSFVGAFLALPFCKLQ